jgi:hypothetical protein
MPQICDMGQDGFYFPSEGWHVEDLFALKNPTASAGFEPANLGTKGHHTTSRPQKPLTYPEITGCLIKYSSVLWLLELQIMRGRKV